MVNATHVSLSFLIIKLKSYPFLISIFDLDAPKYDHIYASTFPIILCHNVKWPYFKIYCFNICFYEYKTFLLDYMKEQVTKLFVQTTKWPTNLNVLSSIVATVRWGKSNYCLISASSTVGRFNMGCASADGDAEYCLASLFYISTSHSFIVIPSITPTCLAHNTLVLFVGDL